uniref:Beta-ureidopropionase n=1 Tax=Amphora coffeiformis TaxID=265554 RepID=A0A7S3LEX9_9STRA|mmetsp:Transcript_6746/g.12962  ORF Transcript_6746/g.12962 Transcript_6746/m.12962 type:complete len:398 (+) Transcript_6746:163-1356(+)
MSGTEPSVEQVLQELDPAKRASVERILYGTTVEPLELTPQATQLATQHDFELKAYRHAYKTKGQTTPRMVRAAVIQNAIVQPTTAPVAVQRQALHDRLRVLIQAAAAAGANVVALQECWTGPFFMCTREKQPWCDFAEEAERGPTFDLMSTLARQHSMVIISPILERDVSHGGTLWNTAVIFSPTGKFLGKHRKNHIPRVGDFNESTYYMEGNTGHPVFETAYGKIAVNICYGRHHPLNWMAFGLNGAEMVFNPCATVGALSEPMWSIEGRCAAIANNYFVLSNNRVGTESFPNAFTSGDGKPAHTDFGHFYGSSYVANPDGSRTPGLCRDRDGVLIQECDLNACQAVKDTWCFGMTARHGMYADLLARYDQVNFTPQRIVDPAKPCSSNEEENAEK